MRVLVRVWQDGKLSIYKGIISTGIQEQEPGVGAQAEKITHAFITSLGFGKQEGVLGQNSYDWDPFNVAGGF